MTMQRVVKIPRLRWLKVIGETHKGKTIAEIAAKVGISESAVAYMRNRAGVKSRHRKGKGALGQRMRLPGLNTASEFMLDPEAVRELEIEEEERAVPKDISEV